MLLYCLHCRKNTESKNPKCVKMENGRLMLLPKCACVIVKSWNLSKSKTLGDY